MTGSRVFKTIFYNGSLWEKWFFASVSYVIKPNQMETKYINTRAEDLSNDTPYDLGKGQWPELLRGQKSWFVKKLINSKAWSWFRSACKLGWLLIGPVHKVRPWLIGTIHKVRCSYPQMFVDLINDLRKRCLELESCAGV